MGLILTFVLVLLVPSSLTQEDDEEFRCTTIDKSSLIVGTPSETCAWMLDELAVACGEFISCALNYSKPMCMCDACAEYHEAVTCHYNNIANYSSQSTSTRERECESLLLREEGVGVLKNSYNLVESLWNNANCKSCEKNPDEEFYRHLNNTLDCWAKFVVDIMLIGPGPTGGNPQDAISLMRKNIVDGKGIPVNHSVCTICSDRYHNLSSYYDDNYGDKHPSPCADIRTHMEMTRIQWSKSFGCGIPARDLRLVWSITAGFVILIILFYGGVYLCGVLEEKKEKRIYSVNSNSDRNFDTTDHKQHLVREETALPVRHTNIN